MAKELFHVRGPFGEFVAAVWASSVDEAIEKCLYKDEDPNYSGLTASSEYPVNPTFNVNY